MTVGSELGGNGVGTTDGCASAQEASEETATPTTGSLMQVDLRQGQSRKDEREAYQPLAALLRRAISARAAELTPRSPRMRGMQ